MRITNEERDCRRVHADWIARRESQWEASELGDGKCEEAQIVKVLRREGRRKQAKLRPNVLPDDKAYLYYFLSRNLPARLPVNFPSAYDTAPFTTTAFTPLEN